MLEMTYLLIDVTLMYQFYPTNNELHEIEKCEVGSFDFAQEKYISLIIHFN